MYITHKLYNLILFSTINYKIQNLKTIKTFIFLINILLENDVNKFVWYIVFVEYKISYYEYMSIPTYIRI